MGAVRERLFAVVLAVGTARMVATHAAGQTLDPYGGYAGLSGSNTSGFFRVERLGGRYTTIDDLSTVYGTTFTSFTGAEPASLINVSALPNDPAHPAIFEDKQDFMEAIASTSCVPAEPLSPGLWYWCVRGVTADGYGGKYCDPVPLYVSPAWMATTTWTSTISSFSRAA